MFGNMCSQHRVTNKEMKMQDTASSVKFLKELFKMPSNVLCSVPEKEAQCLVSCLDFGDHI